MERLGYLSLMIQGFAAFVGLSVLLGRVYFQSHLNSLGIPISDTDLALADYSVVSTRVTVLGIGIAAILPTVMVLGNRYVRSGSSWSISGIVLGLALIGMSNYALFFSGDLDEKAFDPGRTALLTVVMYGMSAGGGILIGASVPISQVAKSVEPGSAFEVVNMTRISQVVIYVMYAGLLVLHSLTYASNAGKLDAEHILTQAPVSQVEFAGASRQHMEDTCILEVSDCSFRVVMIGDKFTYLLPVVAEDAPDTGNLYAVPTNDIRLIVHPKPDVIQQQ